MPSCSAFNIILCLFAATLLAVVHISSQYNWQHRQQPFNTAPAKGGCAISSMTVGLGDKLVILMPVTNTTDMQFYSNMWVGDFLHPVCDYPEMGCRILCNATSRSSSVDARTRCFVKGLKGYSEQYEFFVKMDDSTFADKAYVFELMEKYVGAKQPLYISGLARKYPALNQMPPDGRGKFYMFNRRLVECLDADAVDGGQGSERSVFESMKGTVPLAADGAACRRDAEFCALRFCGSAVLWKRAGQGFSMCCAPIGPGSHRALSAKEQPGGACGDHSSSKSRFCVFPT
ncbi:hypothetical protein GQ54DRAFT_303637 [Martensiomyces pterosporus]|nr:hypothetical protein GQ54DRAFT_303637 [Martensiomyces pterosporus]